MQVYLTVKFLYTRGMSSLEPVAFTVVLPTYNEAESLPITISKLSAFFESLSYQGVILVVDDGSPDGTASIAKELSLTYPVSVIERSSNRGLSHAILEGMAHAKTEMCLMMDADGSHPPEIIRPMVEALMSGADIVVGSRYVKGGGMPDWPFYRQFISRCNAWLALGLSPLTDSTSGCMAVKKSRINWDLVNPLGWKIVLEVCTKHPDCRIVEVPLVFKDRQAGASKASLLVQWDYLVHLYRLYCYRFPTFLEFSRFCLVGISGLCFDFIVISVAETIGHIDVRLASLLGFAASFTSNYILNRYWTFFYGRYAPVWKSYSTYATIASIGFCARLASVQALIFVYPQHQHAWWVAIIGLILGAIITFVGSRAWVFYPAQKP